VAFRERVVAVAPTREIVLVLAGLLLSLVVLTVLVAAGSLTRIDQFSVDHLMPWLKPWSQGRSGSEGFYRPFTLHSTTWSKLFDLWTYPCSVLISSLVVIWAAIVLWKRHGPVVALAPAAAWVIGNGIEVIGKGTITRPALYRVAGGIPVHIDAFDDSFPSGHMMRGVIVAFAIALVFTRSWKWAALWAVLVGPALVLQSAHTVTDVVGGALVGCILLVVMLSLVRTELRVER
jgi:membrane-associated phospholipid phosphatase